MKLNPRRNQRGALGPKLPGHASKAADAHLRYLEPDGVTRDGEKGHAYSALDDQADSRAFLARGRDDRHQFRFIVLDTGLAWIAVDHHNTGHPHTHIIVRGVIDDGRILNIAGDYIAHAVRHRASELVTRELGHQSEIDVARRLASEVSADRLTRLDRMPGGQVHWTANARDAELRLTQQTAGNGVVTSQSFDAATGRLTAILAGAGNIVENFSYTYDVLGNVLTRADANENLTETFTYNALNRVTSATV